MNSNYTAPVNLGHPEEIAIGDFANLIKQMTGSSSDVKYDENLSYEVKRRCPDITRAKTILNWRPEVIKYNALRVQCPAFFVSP